MKKIACVAASLAFCFSATGAFAQQSGNSQATPKSGAAQNSAQTSQNNQQGGNAPDIGVIELDVVTAAWSAKKDILGKPVYNDQNQRIGKIDDIIITPDNAVSFAIIGAGGFLGIGKHDVVIPVDHIQPDENGRYVLPGATKAALKALPAFKYKGSR
jgi:hypothetical protein